MRKLLWNGRNNLIEVTHGKLNKISKSDYEWMLISTKLLV